MSFDLTLTFDNGPDPQVTPQVLTVLAGYRLRTTFFVIGNKLAHDAALAERAHAEGHWLGNHTWSHIPLATMSRPGAAAAEIERTQRCLGPLAHADRLFRPVGGGGAIGPHLLNDEAAALLQHGRYTCVLWNSVPRDWAEPDAWVERALHHCTTQPWTLMVLHDVASGAMRHLPRFLDAALEAGARLRQDFPPACVPLQHGRARVDLSPFVTPGPGSIA